MSTKSISYLVFSAVLAAGLIGCVGDAPIYIANDSGTDSGGNPDATPNTDSGLPDGAVCAEGQGDCQGLTPRTCVGGQWQTGTACSGANPVCMTGQCVQCNPNDSQCSVNTVQKCDSTGHWQDQQACADPTPTCKGGACVCNLTVCGGTCTDMTNDAKNCGACGHDCQGGVCSASVCQDITLASSQVSLSAAIATDGTDVFWGTADSVKRVPAGGGSTSVIASSLTSTTAANFLVVDSTNVYWGNTNGGTIWTCSKSAVSCTPTQVTSGLAGLASLTVDGSNLYWGMTNYSTGKPLVQQCTKGSCSPTTLANTTGSVNSAPGIAVDGSNVYWPSTDGSSTFYINVCTIGGCSLSPTTLISSQPANSIAVDGSNVYWAGGTIGQCDKTNPSKCNSSVKSLVSGQNPTALAVDNTTVYWSISGGSGDIRSCKIGGCGGTATVKGSGPGSTSWGLAIDTNSIFWTNNGGSGSVMQIAK